MVAAFSQAATSTTSTTTTTTKNTPPNLPIRNTTTTTTKISSLHQQQQNSQNQKNPTRLPLEKDPNGLNPRRPRGRNVTSRYLSPSPSISSSNSSFTKTKTTATTSTSSSSNRFPSPLISRKTNSSSSVTTKRSQSVDRSRRSLTPCPSNSHSHAIGNDNGNATPDLSTATKMLITSTRSLSVSFQGEAFSLPISKTKPTTPSSTSTTASTTTTNPSLARNQTPVSRRATPVTDQVESFKPLDQHLWPGRTRQGNSNNSLSRSLDCGNNDSCRFIGFGSGVGVGVKALHHSVIDERRLNLDLVNNAHLLNDDNNPDGNLLLNEPCDLTSAVSDSDSVSSGSTSGAQERRPKTRSTVLSARFWQETNSRLRRLQDPGSPSSTSSGSRIDAPSKFSHSKRFSSDGSMASPRTMASPTRVGTRPASPSKLWTSSPLRGVSPSRVRNLVGGVLNENSSNASNIPSILSFSVDVRRAKVGEDRIVDAHMLRLLYNRYLQWRFVNARADATFMVQKLHTEKNLWNAWIKISELRHSVTLRRVKLLLLRKKLKLTSILKGQITYLEEWSLLDRDHSDSLIGATEALKASTLRLPVVGKAVVDVQNLKDAVGSAVDVMQGMASSICSLSSKVEEMNTLVAEIVNVTANEKVLLEQCKDFLSMLAAMQVKDCSLRTHIIQLNRGPTTGRLTTRV
ncbi:DUF566 domain-containing protein [Cephalotus follicularis]|uniref:DUF566 domain-containing protein n=1 Tax=Cephalotus follicularis TaxID=3775 RepID=A0A1Q3C0T8_CEPFO|nr:DUF566 domain-containing protein [Cephalotus follicularis]